MIPKTPQEIQNFLDLFRINFESDGGTCRSPVEAITAREMHCMEGAMVAAACLRLQGRKPLVLDLKATRNDYDHVVALFHEKTGWGAISKTNHPVLRYREPIYRTPRELALSYFHEYFDERGGKNLRSYSEPFDLSFFDERGWMTDKKDVWYIPKYLDRLPHTPILTPALIRHLRPADPIEIKAMGITEYREHRFTKGYPL